ncbi:GNAT family N-acetyltransferase [Actinoplanes sp. L3-i22]|uniref:GNAT family N-acetyltransferase n=1 Tax=Actinoplanes sp. L3-i22 TaxID=2836373 RepID=UPI001C7458CB|nr:GNAT family protein [Actinoplanes sp. L3-i22]BCY10792.1 hypothetical protein L3i22_058800 [Actinoplanes sp. L3-i22]
MTEPGSQTTVRLIEAADAPALAEHRVRDEPAFARWEPARPGNFSTVEGQATMIENLLAGHRAGTTWPGVVLVDGVVAGQVTVGTILPQPYLRNGSVGYWIGSVFHNRGHATRAVAEILEVMTGELGLHRAEATTRFENLASQTVLRRNGFRPHGVAREHIYLAGAWHDVILWEQILQP